MYPGILNSDEFNKYNVRSNISQLWLYSKIAANDDPKSWSHTLRKLGVDGIVDYDTSTIHTSEPTQAVFFTKEIIEKNIRLVNRGIRNLGDAKKLEKIGKLEDSTGRKIKKKPVIKDVDEHMKKNTEKNLIIKSAMEYIKSGEYAKLTELITNNYNGTSNRIIDLIIMNSAKTSSYELFKNVVKELSDKDMIHSISWTILNIMYKHDDPQTLVAYHEATGTIKSLIAFANQKVKTLLTMAPNPQPKVLKFYLYSNLTKDSIDHKYLHEQFGFMMDDDYKGGFYKPDHPYINILRQYFIDKGYNSKDHQTE
jgi:hypothetical protein